MSRISESIQIHLDSRFSTIKKNNNSADCTYQLPIINTARDSYIHLSLVSMVIPYSFYNINTTNNIFTYTLLSTGTTYNKVLPAGNYNINQIVQWLSLNMGNNMLVSYNSISNKITFSNTLTSFTLTYNEFARCLGFQEPTLNIFETSKTAPYCVNLYTVYNINVESNLLTYNFCNVPNESTTQTIIASIPVITQPQGLISFENKSGYKTNLYVGELSVLQIKLKDNRGNLLDMNGVDYTMSLQIDSVPF
jgi:hypothetical protein